MSKSDELQFKGINGPFLFKNARKILRLFEYLARIQLRACLLVLAKCLNFSHDQILNKF